MGNKKTDNPSKIPRNIARQGYPCGKNTWRRIGIRLSIGRCQHSGPAFRVLRLRSLWKGGFRSAAPLRPCRKTMNEYMTGHRGALATMERQLHNYTNRSEVDGADAPPWRGRHGARSSTHPKFCNALQNTWRRIGIRLSIDRGPHSGYRSCAAYGKADSDPPPPPAMSQNHE